MPLMINDNILAEELIEARRQTGGDRYDEVWEGVYMMSPLANNEHQRLVGELNTAISLVVDWQDLGRTLPGANVSDQPEDWTSNYRVPDVLVFLKETSAEDRGTHWYGGPDFAVEIVSPGDRTLEKLDFYATVNTRELLIVDREPWQLTLYRRQNGARLVPVGVSRLDQLTTVQSSVLPLHFALREKENCLRVTDSTSSIIRDIPISLRAE